MINSNTLYKQYTQNTISTVVNLFIFLTAMLQITTKFSKMLLLFKLLKTDINHTGIKIHIKTSYTVVKESFQLFRHKLIRFSVND